MYLSSFTSSQIRHYHYFPLNKKESLLHRKLKYLPYGVKITAVELGIETSMLVFFRVGAMWLVWYQHMHTCQHSAHQLKESCCSIHNAPTQQDYLCPCTHIVLYHKCWSWHDTLRLVSTYPGCWSNHFLVNLHITDKGSGYWANC